MVLRDEKREIARISQNDEDWTQYRIVRNLCTSMQDKDRKQFWKNKLEKIEEEKDAAGLFSQTRSLLSWKKSGSPTSFLIDGKILRKQQEIADAQIDFFAQKIEKLKNKIPKVNFDPLEILKKEFRKWKPEVKTPKMELKMTNPDGS